MEFDKICINYKIDHFPFFPQSVMFKVFRYILQEGSYSAELLNFALHA